MAELLQPSKQRYLFIDLYRTGIIILMLEGHVLRALLTPALQQTDWFSFHEFFHGLSAPAFLFGAGLTFVISTRKRWEDYHHWNSPMAKRVGRFLVILGLGMALHLPFFSIRKIIMEGSQANFLQLFQSDVLICISLGLLSLHGILFFFKKERRFYYLVVGISLVFCFLTPIAWNYDFLNVLPLPLAQLFNMQHGSPFPLFPFIGFLYAGVLTSWEFLYFVQQGREKNFMMRLPILGAAMILVGLYGEFIPSHQYGYHDFWYTCPAYFFIRTGSLLLITAAIWYISQKIQSPSPWLTVMGRESLFVYVFHLPLLYGSVINPSTNLTKRVGMTLNVAEAIGVFLALTVFLLILVSFWHYLKTKQYHLYRVIQIAGAFWFLFELFTRDF